MRSIHSDRQYSGQVIDFYPFRESLKSVQPKVTNRVVWGGGIRLDRAEVPFPPSPKVIQAVANWVKEGNRYPEPDCATLKSALSDTEESDDPLGM